MPRFFGLKQRSKFPILIIMGIVVLGLTVLLIRRISLQNKTNQQNSQNQHIPLEQWITYDDPKGRFSILLPQKPTEDTKKDIYSATNNTAKYTLKIVAGATLATLDNEVKKLLQSSGRSAKLIYADHHKDASETEYLDFKIQTSEKIVKGRMFLIKGSVYILSDEVPVAENDADAFNHFLSSFGLL